MTTHTRGSRSNRHSEERVKKIKSEKKISTKNTINNENASENERNQIKTIGKKVEGSLTYITDERVLCYHGPLIYEAKILKGEIWENKKIPEENGPHYYVHYKGWKQTWDEWVPEERILKFNEDNIKKQISLKDSVYSTHSRSHEKKSNDSGTDRGKKRTRESTKVIETVKKIEIKIPIPDSLKFQLVEDWENITKDQKLVPLPRKPTVLEILNEYKEQSISEDQKRENDLIAEMLDGIQLYFDKALGNILLYRFERKQFNDIQKENPEKKVSEIYGAEHLLRLFVQFPLLLSDTNLDQDSLTILQQYLTDFLKFFSKNQKKYFLTEYENASPVYISQIDS